MNFESLANENKQHYTESSRPSDMFDKRVEKDNTIHVDSKSFDPDKRVEKQTDKPDSKESYNPDHRLKDDGNEGKDVDKLVKEYEDDIKNNSEFKDTLSNVDLDPKDFEKVPAEKVKELRSEFNKNKDKIIAQWEKDNGKSWPTYEKDVTLVTKTGEVVTIHKAGERYDAHHIHPLSMGGKNEAKNITPMHADVHGDHRGVHAKDGAYGKLEAALGGK